MGCARAWLCAGVAVRGLVLLPRATAWGARGAGGTGVGCAAGVGRAGVGRAGVDARAWDARAWRAWAWGARAWAEWAARTRLLTWGARGLRGKRCMCGRALSACAIGVRYRRACVRRACVRAFADARMHAHACVGLRTHACTRTPHSRRRIGHWRVWHLSTPLGRACVRRVERRLRRALAACDVRACVHACVRAWVRRVRRVWLTLLARPSLCT